jgi:hypothetical protein
MFLDFKMSGAIADTTTTNATVDSDSIDRATVGPLDQKEATSTTKNVQSNEAKSLFDDNMVVPLDNWQVALAMVTAAIKFVSTPPRWVKFVF